MCGPLLSAWAGRHSDSTYSSHDQHYRLSSMSTYVYTTIAGCICDGQPSDNNVKEPRGCWWLGLDLIGPPQRLRSRAPLSCSRRGHLGALFGAACRRRRRQRAATNHRLKEAHP